MALDIFEAVRAIALSEVMEETPGYHLREIMRWYAREYSITPLEAESLPLLHVLLDYYEHVFKEANDQDREEERAALLETDEDRLAKGATRDADALKTKEFEDMARKLNEEAGKYAPKRQETAAAPAIPESALPGALRALPDVKMKFDLPGPEDELENP